MISEEIYDEASTRRVLASEGYGIARGDIVADGEAYDPCYGERWSYITDEDIKQLKEGKMLYISDGEYANCIVYKKEENNEQD